MSEEKTNDDLLKELNAMPEPEKKKKKKKKGKNQPKEEEEKKEEPKEEIKEEQPKNEEVGQVINDFTKVLMNQQGLMFNGQPISESDREKIVIAILRHINLSFQVLSFWVLCVLLTSLFHAI